MPAGAGGGPTRGLGRSRSVSWASPGGGDPAGDARRGHRAGWQPYGAGRPSRPLDRTGLDRTGLDRTGLDRGGPGQGGAYPAGQLTRRLVGKRQAEHLLDLDLTGRHQPDHAPRHHRRLAAAGPSDDHAGLERGRGSGQTTVMAGRVVWLVATGQVEIEQVLGLTFTNKAAGELASRVRAALL